MSYTAGEFLRWNTSCGSFISRELTASSKHSPNLIRPSLITGRITSLLQEPFHGFDPAICYSYVE